MTKSNLYFCSVMQDQALGGWGVAVAVVGGIETFITWFVGCMACCWAPYHYEGEKVSLFKNFEVAHLCR